MGIQVGQHARGLSLLALKAIGAIPSHIARLWLYRRCGMRVGTRSYIYGGAEVRSPSKIVIGSDVIVGNYSTLDGRNGLFIDDNVNISSGVWIWTMQHDHRSPTFEASGGEVRIGKNSWISSRATILPGVEIGEGCIVAAGAVVTKSFPPYTIIGGVPGKKIGTRKCEIRYKLGDSKPTSFI